MWGTVFHRMILALYIMTFTMIGLLGLKKAPGPAAVLLGCPVLITIVRSYCVKRFEIPGATLPLERARAVDNTSGSKAAPLMAGETKAGTPAPSVQSAYARPSFNPLYDFKKDEPEYDPNAENPLASQPKPEDV